MSMTFDAWEGLIRPTNEDLMHFGIPGMKHGRRRYQNEDGTWTEAGLEARRKREGFGESRKERKAQKQIAKAEKHQAKKAAKAERQAQRAEARRKRKLSGLTDEEMKAKLERAKMEAEYRDLKKRGSLIETGTRMIEKYLDYKDRKEQRAINLNQQKIDMERIRAQREQSRTQAIQAKEATKQSKNQIKISKNEANKSGAEAAKMKYDVKGGLKIKRKAELKDAKKRYRDTTIRGAIGKLLNNGANRGKERRDHEHELKVKEWDFKEQNARRANAETIAKSNEVQAAQKAQQARFNAEQEKHHSSTARSQADQAKSERTWREINAKTEYEREKKKKK